MKSIFFLVSFLLSIQIFAQSDDLAGDLAGDLVQSREDLEYSIDPDTFKRGYEEAPVIPCPKLKQKYADMLSQLNSVKQKIKDETCKDSEIQAINAEVTDLKSLLGDRRKAFLEIVKKGTSATEQLTTKETQAVQAYINQVVAKSAALTGFLSNTGCFDEDEKDSTLSTVSALVGDVTGAIGALTGPWGAKVSIFGQVTAGLMSSVDKIIKANTTYEFYKADHRRFYLNNLCTFYEIKKDLDKETQSELYKEKVVELEGRAVDVINLVQRDCPDCQKLVEDFSDRLEGERSYVLLSERRQSDQSNGENSDKINISYKEDHQSWGDGEAVLIRDAYRPDDQGQVRYAEAETSTGDMEAVAPVDMSGADLFNFYIDDGLIAKVDVGRELPSPSPGLEASDGEGESVAAPIVLGPRSDFRNDRRKITIHALQSYEWARNEIKTIPDADADGLADDNFREIIRVQKQLENMLVREEASKYLEFYSQLLQEDYNVVERVARNVNNQFEIMRLQPDPNADHWGIAHPVARAFHDVFRDDHEFASVFMHQNITVPKERFEKFRQSSKKRLLGAIKPVRVDFKILRERCAFFKNSLFVENEDLNVVLTNKCKKIARKRRDIKKFFADLENTAYATNYLDFITFVNEDDVNYKPDWIRSTSDVLKKNFNELDY